MVYYGMLFSTYMKHYSFLMLSLPPVSFKSHDLVLLFFDHPFSALCLLHQDAGTCNAYIPSWFYNKETQNCEEFIYGGCFGNANRFATEADCQRACSREGLSVCRDLFSTSVINFLVLISFKFSCVNFTPTFISTYSSNSSLIQCYFVRCCGTVYIVLLFSEVPLHRVLQDLFFSIFEVTHAFKI